MGKRRIVLILGALVLAVVVFGSGVAVGAAGNGAGSQNDPVVSLSYLEYRLGRLEGNTVNESSNTGYSKVTLLKGETYTPGEGSIIVIYSGNATVVGNDGLINITEGTVLQESYSTVLYNQFLVPSDGAGIKAAGNVTLFVLK